VMMPGALRPKHKRCIKPTRTAVGNFGTAKPTGSDL
jgi:hypothetical protein